jgi:hypothetical protein
MINIERELKIIKFLVKHDYAILENAQCEVIYRYDKILRKVREMPIIYLREEIYNKIKNKNDEVIARIVAVKSMGKNIKHYFQKKLTAEENEEILLRAAIIEKFYDLRAPRHDNYRYYVFRPIMEDILNPILQWYVEEECLEDEERYENAQ